MSTSIEWKVEDTYALVAKNDRFNMRVLFPKSKMATDKSRERMTDRLLFGLYGGTVEAFIANALSLGAIAVETYQ